MGKIEGIRIQNYGPLKDITLGKNFISSKYESFGESGFSYRGKRKRKEYFCRCILVLLLIVWKLGRKQHAMRIIGAAMTRFRHKEAIIRFLLNCVIGNPVMSDPLSMSWL